MRRLLLAAAVLGGALAVAATRAKDTHGVAVYAQPSGPSAGVSLEGVVGCRMSVRVDGGGDIASGCKLVPWYYDSTALNTWVESATSLACTTTATLDGGQRSSYVCTDLTPAARFGRIAVQMVDCVGWDGGTGSAHQTDSGILSRPISRIECWGPNVVNP